MFIEKKVCIVVVICCWDEYFFCEDDVVNVCLMIIEFVMVFGGCYDVYFFI